jgi:SAM-dependent methyltransferase
VSRADVPSPIDLRRMGDAVEWEATAMAKRPWRNDFFAAFSSAIGAWPTPAHRVLELGSGPGFLAAHLLEALPSISYVALDFSAAMHGLAAARLGPLASRVKFVERSFLDDRWPGELGLFDAIVTHQAVHELRHKDRACGLHSQAAGLLAPGGVYLVCDHVAGGGGMADDQLYMTVDEQAAALAAAGFGVVEQLLLKGGLVLHRASVPSARDKPKVAM